MTFENTAARATGGACPGRSNAVAKARLRTALRAATSTFLAAVAHRGTSLVPGPTAAHAAAAAQAGGSGPPGPAATAAIAAATKIINDENADVVKLILEGVGGILPVLLFLSPFRTVLSLRKNKSVGTVPSLSFTTMVANCALWALFGVGLGERAIIAPNSVGVLLSVFYCLSYSSAATSGAAAKATKDSDAENSLPKRQLADFRMQSAVLLGLLAIGAALFQTQQIDRLGGLAAVMSVTMGAAPLAKIGDVVRTGKTDMLGAPEFAVAGFACSAVWFVLGRFYIRKEQVWVPNALSTTANATTLLLFLVYSRKFRGLLKSFGSLFASQPSRGRSTERRKIQASGKSSGSEGSRSGSNVKQE